MPSDTLFGRAVNDSGFATPLVMLGFSGLWVLPVDRRPGRRRHLRGGVSPPDVGDGADAIAQPAGAVRGEGGCGVRAFACWRSPPLAISATAAGVLGVGAQPLVDLSGVVLPPVAALQRIALAWISVLPPCLGFLALAMAVAVTTRSSVAAVGFPVLAALAMQLSGARSTCPTPRGGFC